MQKRFPLTDMPMWLVLVLTAVMLPRTILNDLGWLDEGTLAYRILALVPFGIWFVVALVRKTRKPWGDFLVLGVLFGLSLALAHQVLWDVSSSLGHRPPAAAVDFANNFGSSFHDLAVRAYTVMISMGIGIGSGAAFAGIAAIVTRFRPKH